jgi:hypothetical protein
LVRTRTSQNSKRSGTNVGPHKNSYDYVYPTSFEPTKIPKYTYPIPSYQEQTTPHKELSDKDIVETSGQDYSYAQEPYFVPQYGGKMDQVGPYPTPDSARPPPFQKEFEKYPKFAEKEPPQDSETKPNVFDYFGIFPNVPMSLILKGCSIILLVILVEMNAWINLDSLHPVLAESIGKGAVPFIGVSAIGIFLGFLFRYMDFELFQLKSMPKEQRSGRFKSYLTLIFLFAITIFIMLEVIVELINARGFLVGTPGGALFLLDLLVILIVTIGTYAVFSKNHSLSIITIMLLIIIMLIGIDYGTNLPMMVVLGCLTILYIEITDSALRISEYITKFYSIVETHDETGVLRNQIDNHMDSISIKFLKNLAVFIALTLTITGMLLLVFVSYPYLTPSFIHENLELQTVYALIPIITLLFVIFMFYRIIMKYLTPMEHGTEQRIE